MHTKLDRKRECKATNREKKIKVFQHESRTNAIALLEFWLHATTYVHIILSIISHILCM